MRKLIPHKLRRSSWRSTVAVVVLMYRFGLTMFAAGSQIFTRSRSSLFYNSAHCFRNSWKRFSNSLILSYNVAGAIFSLRMPSFKSCKQWCSPTEAFSESSISLQLLINVYIAVSVVPFFSRSGATFLFLTDQLVRGDTWWHRRCTPKKRFCVVLF